MLCSYYFNPHSGNLYPRPKTIQCDITTHPLFWYVPQFDNEPTHHPNRHPLSAKTSPSISFPRTDNNTFINAMVCCSISAVDQPEAHLRRQVALCRDLLEVADRLEPGFSPFRGKLLVALRDALLILLGRGEDDLSPQAAPPVDSNGGHVRPTTSVTTMAASAATTTSKRRRQKGRINTEVLNRLIYKQC